MQIKQSSYPSTAPVAESACLVCGSQAACIGAVDFNKVPDQDGQAHPHPPLSPVHYHRCAFCGFTFAPQFLSWSEQDFREKVYNDGYGKHDPDYRLERPRTNARYLEQLFTGSARPARHLDYGGGNGVLSQILGGQGWNSLCYDPFAQHDQDVSRLGKFDLITAFEVFEHVPDPNEMVPDGRRLPGAVFHSPHGRHPVR